MIWQIILKNFRILLRNYSTLFFILFVPVLLMLLVGYTYGGGDYNDVNIGLINVPDDFDSEIKFKGMNMKHYINLNNESNVIKECFEDLKLNDVHLCIKYDEKLSDSGELIGADVTYYYDSTRKVSGYLLTSFQRYFNFKTREISSSSVDLILVEIKRGVEFLNSTRGLVFDLERDLEDIDLMLNESLLLLDLIDDNFANVQKSIRNERDLIDSSLNNLPSEFSNLDSSIDNLTGGLVEIENRLSVVKSEVEVPLLALREIVPVQAQAEIDSVLEIVSTLDEVSSLVSDLNNVSLLNFKNDLEEQSIYRVSKSLDEIDLYLIQFGGLLSAFREDMVTLHSSIVVQRNQIDFIKNDLDENLEKLTSVSSIDADDVVNPISQKAIPILEDLKPIDKLIPVVIIMIALFVGLLLSNTLVSLEIRTNAYSRLALSKVSQGEIILGLFVTSIFFILVQLVLILLVLEFAFGIDILSIFWSLILVIFNLLLFFVLMGIFLGYFFKSEQLSILATVFTSLFLFLLSGIIVPMELMPEFMGAILAFNPVVIGNEVLHNIIFFNYFNIGEQQFLIFYLYIALLIGGIQFSAKKRKDVF